MCSCRSKLLSFKALRNVEKNNLGYRIILCINFRGKHEIVKSNIDVLVSIGLGERAKHDAVLVRDTCTILLTVNKTEEKVRVSLECFE